MTEKRTRKTSSPGVSVSRVSREVKKQRTRQNF